MNLNINETTIEKIIRQAADAAQLASEVSDIPVKQWKWVPDSISTSFLWWPTDFDEDPPSGGDRGGW